MTYDLTQVLTLLDIREYVSFIMLRSGDILQEKMLCIMHGCNKRTGEGALSLPLPHTSFHYCLIILPLTPAWKRWGKLLLLLLHNYEGSYWWISCINIQAYKPMNNVKKINSKNFSASLLQFSCSEFDWHQVQDSQKEVWYNIYVFIYFVGCLAHCSLHHKAQGG